MCLPRREIDEKQGERARSVSSAAVEGGGVRGGGTTEREGQVGVQELRRVKANKKESEREGRNGMPNGSRWVGGTGNHTRIRIGAKATATPARGTARLPRERAYIHSGGGGYGVGVRKRQLPLCPYGHGLCCERLALCTAWEMGWCGDGERSALLSSSTIGICE